jgi:hypothetical protein
MDMNKLCMALAIVGTLSPFPALSGEITLNQPAHGASLNEGLIDMAVYFTESPVGSYEVVATYVAKDAPEQANRIRMSLHDGDSTTFALPGYRQSLYSFRRLGSQIEVSVAAPDHQRDVLQY